MEQWAYEKRVQLHSITPRRPMENGYIESCNAKLRDECLNDNWFFELAGVVRSPSGSGTTTMCGGGLYTRPAPFPNYSN